MLEKKEREREKLREREKEREKGNNGETRKRMRHRLLISILPRDFFRAKLYEPETLQLICLPNLPALFVLYKREGAKNATFPLISCFH